MTVVELAGGLEPAAGLERVRAAGLERVRVAAAEGADIVEVAGAGAAGEAGSVAAFVAAIRDVCPELVIGVRTGRRDVARAAGADLFIVAGAEQPSGPGVAGLGLAEEAAECGAAVICPPVLAARVAEAGVEPERIVVRVPATGPVAEVAEVAEAGWPVLVSLPDLEGAGSLATAAVAAWAGARVFRVRRVRETRRALRMVSAICGDIPPAYALRGLALTAT
jgi:dihydropteroate synthase